MIRFIPLGGFLGAGKTTTMLALARLLEQRGECVSLITNDQGNDLVDTQLAQAAGFAGTGEVTGGCFCCRFDDLAAVVARLTDEIKPTVVIAEAVGSCTDLQSTVVRPLRELYGDQLTTSPLAVLLDPVRHAAMTALALYTGDETDLAHLYRHQLEEADIIAVNKADLLTSTAMTSLLEDLRTRFPHAQVIAYSASTGTGLADLLAAITSTAPSGHRAFAIDYDRYATAEAELAWTNQTFTLTGRGFSPSAWITAVLTQLNNDIAERGTAIGHIKVRLTTPSGATAKASLTQAGGAISVDERDDGPADQAEVTFNARVQVRPEELDKLIEDAVRAADAAASTISGKRSGDIFQPGYPTPVHRM